MSLYASVCVQLPIMYAYRDVFRPISCSQFPWQHLSESTDVGERGKELRQLLWWRVLKKEEPVMMSVKQCEPWDETERETDACVVSE